MAFPDIPLFSRLLQSLTLVEQECRDGIKEILALPAFPARDGNRATSYPAWKIWYEVSELLPFESLVEKVNVELNRMGHPRGQGLAMSVLCMFCLVPEHTAKPVQILNELMALISDARLSQFFVLPASFPDGKGFKIGEFSIGKLNAERLAYRIQKAGSDYFVRDEPNLTNRLAIERAPFTTKVFDWTTFQRAHSSSAEMIADLAEHYFNYLSLAHRDALFEALLECQHLLIAAGAPYLNERLLQQLPNGITISIFQEIGISKTGFVCPIGSSDSVMLQHALFNIAIATLKIPPVLQRLSTDFGVTELNDSEVHQTIKTYSLFLSKAWRYISDGHEDEGFLHSIIALDLLFGDANASTDKVSSRTAIVTHHALQMSFEDAKKQVKAIYGARSKYVHNGKAVDPHLIEPTRIHCIEVLNCLLRLQNAPSSCAAWTATRWIARLDYLIGSIGANITVGETEWEDSGILRASEKSESA